MPMLEKTFSLRQAAEKTACQCQKKDFRFGRQHKDLMTMLEKHFFASAGSIKKLMPMLEKKYLQQACKIPHANVRKMIFSAPPAVLAKPLS